MSVVAWDGRVLAADSMAENCGMKRPVKKLFVEDGFIAAFTGGYAEGLAMLEWYKSGADLAKYPAFQSSDDWTRLIVAHEYGFLSVYEKAPVAVPHDMDVPHAWGQGRDFAIGAMAEGASAVRAVEVACIHATYCGQPIVCGSLK